MPPPPVFPASERAKPGVLAVVAIVLAAEVAIAIAGGAIWLLVSNAETSSPSPPQSELREQLAERSTAERYGNHEIRAGMALGRLSIPAIDLDVVFVESTSSSALRAGVGHYPGTSYPCEQGNAVLAGKRTTRGSPFKDLLLLRVGDVIEVESPGGACTYRVTVINGHPAVDSNSAAAVVAPDQVDILYPISVPLLTLTTSHPEGSSDTRLVVQAELQPTT